MISSSYLEIYYKKVKSITMSLHSLISKLNEEIASADLYQKFWKNDLTNFKIPKVSESERKWILNFINKDSVFQIYSDEEKKKCLDLTFKIEASIPIISDIGKAMPAYHRLYTSFEIAKTLLRRSQTVLDIISSIVIYSGGSKLRKDYEEGGLMIAQGYNYHHARFSALVQSLTAIDSFAFAREEIVGKSFHKLLKDFKHWQRYFKLVSEDEGKKSQFLSFLKKSKDTFKTDFEPNFTRFANKSENPETKALLLSFNSSLQDNLSSFIKQEDLLSMENEVSLHLAWFSHLTYLTTPQSNLIVHELAHAIDFEYAGMDGVPSTDIVENSSITKDWTQFFEEALSGAYPFLNPYALTNSYEFFACISEHFFRDPKTIQSKAPKLFKALEDVYGESHMCVVKKWSGWKLFKTISFSKLNASF